MPTPPDGLVLEPVHDEDLGVLRFGKEAQINIHEWTGADGATSLVARKLYLPREVKEKGTLEQLGAQRATAFRHDVSYREGRQFRRSRDRRAVERMSAYGRRLLQDRWTGHEFEVMSKLWAGGAPVPYPIHHAGDVFYLDYVGARDRAAPQLAQARLSAAEVSDAFDQVVDGLHAITAAGYAHGDLSAFNLLWWDGQVVFIDFPQAVDLAANPNGLDYLHRDLLNVCAWFTKRGLDVDAEEVFADVMMSAFG